MLSRGQLSSERLPKCPAITGDDRSDLWRDLAWFAPALSRKIYRPEHELSIARFRGQSVRMHHLRHLHAFRGYTLPLTARGGRPGTGYNHHPTQRVLASAYNGRHWGTVPELVFEKKQLIPALQQLFISYLSYKI